MHPLRLHIGLGVISTATTAALYFFARGLKNTLVPPASDGSKEITQFANGYLAFLCGAGVLGGTVAIEEMWKYKEDKEDKKYDVAKWTSLVYVVGLLPLLYKNMKME
jgi:hypothetical protein